MANRYFTQFFYTLHKMPTLLDCNVVIGASGAVGTITGSGIKSVTNLATGVYQVQFLDNYYRYFGGVFNIQSPTTGGNVASGSLTPGSMYVITALGTTNWQTAGLPQGITAAIGQPFLCASTASGTGTAALVGSSGITTIEVVGNTSLMQGPQGVPNQGGYATVQCLGATNSSTTTLIPTNPASGSVLYMAFYLSNSSVLLQGE